MTTTGELKQNKIIIKKPKEAGRLYNKSHFGTTLKGNKLQLDLIEAIFLVDEKKIETYSEGKKITLEKLIKLAANNIQHFNIIYTTYKDLRKRGHAVKHVKQKNTGFPQLSKEGKFITTIFSEHDSFDTDLTKQLLKKISKKKEELWFAIVDKEGDITYYNVSSLKVKGKNREHVFKKTKGYLVDDRVVIFDKKTSEDLFKKEFYGKPFTDGLQISLIEGLYLVEKKVLDVFDVNDKKISKKILKNVTSDSEFLVFKTLKKLGFIVKTGFKFGADFRAYSYHPDEGHAEFLFHVVNAGFSSVWSKVSSVVRLAHSVNKEIVFAVVDKDCIDFIRFGRLKP
jgi:tRNA-intron endonuclease